MEIRNETDGWVFEEIDPFIIDLLRVIPECASTDDEAARKRIFSSLTDGEDTAADEDWREYVEPDLRELFKSHTDIVAADLRTMRTDSENATLRIPLSNARAWIHTLNQARLSLAARHGVDESESENLASLSGPKGFILMQLDFYGTILSFLLTRTEL